MDKVEASKILLQELNQYRSRSQAELSYLLDNPDTFERTARSGTVYQLEIDAFWDDEPKRELRVMGCIDDMGWSALSPLCDSFIIREDGSFVGE